ncbi:MAG TPA: class I SAM-dependent methyltransferase [Actinomycetes bacterium]|jgi:SAM-dependent methyltransferase|nr:class I SAM-dependent methyltransferase [Actinomycetes bacterium]
MEGYRPETYGDRIADVYDQWYGDRPGLDDCVELLAALAGPGPVLELGIGTGRVALPLAARGQRVHGVDASEAMVARLRAKPGGEAVQVTVGDLGEVPAEGPFSLVFVVFNTFFCLLTQDDQVRCFARVAERLAPGGAFVVEAFVPDPRRLAQLQELTVDQVGADRVVLSATRRDPVGQRIDSQHLVLGADGIRMQPVAIRYAWPAELDLMARLAGLRLRDRWAGWRREPFSADSSAHVSVYERA